MAFINEGVHLNKNSFFSSFFAHCQSSNKLKLLSPKGGRDRERKFPLKSKTINNGIVSSCNHDDKVNLIQFLFLSVSHHPLSSIENNFYYREIMMMMMGSIKVYCTDGFIYNLNWRYLSYLLKAKMSCGCQLPLI